MTLNRSTTAYKPGSFTQYAIPVQEGSVDNLCPTVTPAGQGVLSWVDHSAGELRCAVLADRSQMFFDDVVESGDVRTVWSGAETIHTGCIAVVGGDLFAFVSFYSGPTGTIECHIADDPEDPTSWSLRGTVQSHTSPDSAAVLTVRNGGPPVITDSGRWVLPFHAWVTFAASDLEDGIGLHYSDDQGASWTTVVQDRKGALSGGSAGRQSTTIAEDPATGLLHFGSHVGPVAGWYHYQSADGATWTRHDLDGGIDPYYFIDDGTDYYAARLVGTSINLFRVDDPQDFSTWDDLGITALVGVTSDEDDGVQLIPLFLGGGYWRLAVTMKDRIAYARRNWHVGFVGNRT